jgi:hypothetical protein
MKKLLFCLTLLGIFQQSCAMKEESSKKEKVAVLECPLRFHRLAQLPMLEEQTKQVEGIKKQIAASTDLFTNAFEMYEERLLHYPDTKYVEENLRLEIANLKARLAGIYTKKKYLSWDTDPKSVDYARSKLVLTEDQRETTKRLMEAEVIYGFLQLHKLEKVSQELACALNKQDSQRQCDSKAALSEDEQRANLEKLGRFVSEAS